MTDFVTLDRQITELTASVNNLLQNKLSLNQTRYVDQSTGNDNNSGFTADEPKRSIKSAIDSVFGGYLDIYVAGNYTLGLHSEDNDLVIWNKTVVIRSNYVGGNHPTFTFNIRNSNDRIHGSTGRSVRNFSFNGFAGLKMINWRIVLPTLDDASNLAINPYGTPFNFFAPEPSGFTSLTIQGGLFDFPINNHVTLMNGGPAITQPTALFMSNYRWVIHDNRAGRFINTQQTSNVTAFHRVSGGILTDPATRDIRI